MAAFFLDAGDFKFAPERKGFRPEKGRAANLKKRVQSMATKNSNIRSFISTAFQLLKQTTMEWLGDKAPQLGAALAYYTVFSLTPLILVLLEKTEVERPRGTKTLILL